VTDPQQTVSWRRGDIQDGILAFDAPGDFPLPPSGGEATAGLVSLGYVWSAVRREWRTWCILAVIGLILGGGYAAAKPPAYSATTTVLVNNLSDPQGTLLETDISLAQSVPVASAVIAQLGERGQTPEGFLGTYTAALVTTQVMSITAKGPTGGVALARAAAVARQFLAFRGRYLQEQYQEESTGLNEQVSQAQQHLDAVNKQIQQVSAQPSSSSQQGQLTSLKAQQTDATVTLGQVKQDVVSTRSQDQTNLTQEVQGSEVLSPAALGKRSVLKTGLLYGAGGLVGGLGLGIAIVAIAAITSDRLRRRDDIAYALGAPVRLSLGRLRKRRWSVDLRGKAAAVRQRDMDRLVQHLRNAVPGTSGVPAGLAVIATDDTLTTAQAVVGLAGATAKRKRVVLADLSSGLQAASILGTRSPGVTPLDHEGGRILVVVPAAADVAPVGPLRSHAAAEGHGQPDEAVAAACAHADLVLSLVTLDPAYGGDHLGTWATDAVAVVTTGRSTATSIRAVGEMIRLAGTQVQSVVVVDADDSDESLGALVGDK